MAIPFQVMTYHTLRGVESKKALPQKNINDAEKAIGGYFDKTGAFVKRQGGEKYNTTALSGRITGLYDWKYDNETSEKLIITANTNIYDGNSGSPSSIKSGLTDDKIFDFTEYRIVSDIFNSSKDFLFMCNGTDTNMQYDGTNVYNMGIDKPAVGSLSGAGNAGAGSLTGGGTYVIAVTYVNADKVESNPCTSISVTIGGGDNEIALSNIPVSSDAQVTDRYIYMTSAGGALLKYNKAIGNNTSTSVTITAESAGANLEYNHDNPPVFNFLETGKNRLYGAVNNRFFLSRIYRPFYWPQGEADQTQIYYFDVGDGSPITGIKYFYDYVLIFKKNSVWVFSGDDLNPRLEQVRADDLIGCVSNRTIVVYENWCYFLGTDGFYRTNGNVIQDVSKPISDYFNQNSDVTRFKINKGSIGKSCATIDKENGLVLLFVPTGSDTENTMCYCMGLDNISMEGEDLKPNWSHLPGFTTTSATTVYENGRAKWFRGDDNGYVFRQNALNGDGSNISSTATSGGNTTLTDTTQSWTVNLYAGLRVNILDGTGAPQERTIVSNTSDTLTVNSAWDTNPDSTSEYSIGGIEYQYQHSWHHYGQPTLSKRWRYVRPRFDATGNYDVTFTFGYDFSEEDNDEQSVNLSPTSLWDTALWDTAVWDGSTVIQTKYPLSHSRIHRYSCFSVTSKRAGQPITYNGCDKIFQVKGIR